MKQDKFYSMKITVEKAGLSPHVIRVWEKRYQALTPERTETNRRLYSDEDIERLILLRKATQSGHSIGQIANLPNSSLRVLVSETETGQSNSKNSKMVNNELTPNDYVRMALDAIDSYDAPSLHRMLEKASVTLSRPALLANVITPFMQHIGDRWAEGTLRVGQEHLASAVVRSFLGSLREGIDPSDAGPAIVIATPIGQLHELGALMVALSAGGDGWKVAYLGANLPAEEIAGVAQKLNAKVVAISLSYTGDTTILEMELRRLRRFLPEETQIIIGGRIHHYFVSLASEIRAEFEDDINKFRKRLYDIRNA